MYVEYAFDIIENFNRNRNNLLILKYYVYKQLIEQSKYQYQATRLLQTADWAKSSLTFIILWCLCMNKWYMTGSPKHSKNKTILTDN